MQYNFDEIIDRRNSDSIKWNLYDEDVLPLWVADMDFQSPQPVIDALENRIKHGVFGYPGEDQVLKEVICDRMASLYNWKIKSENIVFLPGVVNGFNLVIQALTEEGQEVLMQPPVYHPFLSAAQNAQAIRKESPLQMGQDRKYYIDFDHFEKSIEEKTKVFLLCNPHNPVGRVFSQEELLRLAGICLNKNTIICSDEIHADFVFDGYRHIPIASLNKEVAMNTITLMAPSKTYNIAGLGMSYAIVQNPDLREKLNKAKKGIVPHVNILGMTAASAAYQFGDEWLNQVMIYIQKNWQFLVEFVRENMPAIKITPMEGTYLAWLDCRDLPVENSYEFFLQQARVAFNDGKIFGNGGEGFIRLNFGSPRSLLVEGLERMKDAVNKLS